MLSKMSTANNFFKIEERSNGDLFWNNVPVEIEGDEKLTINNKVFNMSTNLQNVLTNTNERPIKKLKDVERIEFRRILESTNYKKYRRKRKKLLQVDKNRLKTILINTYLNRYVNIFNLKPNLKIKKLKKRILLIQKDKG